jgi:RsiW-degrading membrane proteinase PrsW (M82 family)
MGASTWQVGSAPVELSNLLSNLGARLNRLTSTEKLEGFSLKAFFSEVFKKRQKGEIEDYFVVGTAKTTPPLDDVQTGWPKPWFFMRVLAFMAAVYVIFWQSLAYFGNPNDFPGTIVIGALAVPLATVVLLWELNTPRNVSFIQVLMLVAFGGAVSLALEEVVDRLSHLEFLGAPSAGFVEETAKLLAVIVVVRSAKHKYILNGIVFGAAIGAGFSAFETAGYAFYHAYMPQMMHNTFRVAAKDLSVGDASWNSIVSLYANNKHLNVDALTGWASAIGEYGTSALLAGLDQVTSRAYLAQFGHIVWTAIAAGAFWRVKGADPFKVKMLTDRAFIRTFLIPVVLHATWDLPWGKILSAVLGQEFVETNPDLSHNLVYFPLGIIAWYVAFLLVQQGLRQIKEAQVTHIQTEYTHTRETLTTTGRFRTQNPVR